MVRKATDVLVELCSKEDRIVFPGSSLKSLEITSGLLIVHCQDSSWIELCPVGHLTFGLCRLWAFVVPQVCQLCVPFCLS